MKKEMVRDFFDGAQNLADRLGYRHRNVYYRWPSILTDRIKQQIFMRMKAARISIPKEWKV